MKSFASRVATVAVAVAVLTVTANIATVNAACPDTMPVEVKEVCEAATSINLDAYPVSDGVKDLQFTLTVKFAPKTSTTVTDPCGDGMDYDLANDAVDIGDVPSTIDVVPADVTREIPHLEFVGCEPGSLYTLIMLDAKKADARGVYDWPKFYDANNNGQSMHWIEHNIVCSEDGTAMANSNKEDDAYLPYVAPGAFDMDPFNYGFYVYEQNGTLVPSFPDFNRDLALAAFVDHYKDASFLVDNQGPVARSWVQVTAGPFSAELWKELAGGEFGWLYDGSCRALSHFAAVSKFTAEACPEAADDESSEDGAATLSGESEKATSGCERTTLVYGFGLAVATLSVSLLDNLVSSLA